MRNKVEQKEKKKNIGGKKVERKERKNDTQSNV